MAKRDQLQKSEAGLLADPPLLNVANLRTGFRTPAGTAWAVDDVSFTLDQGKTLGLVGESGCGKTMLSRSIMGLLPRSGVESSGQVLLDGENLTAMTPEQLRRIWGVKVAMIFQDPMTCLNPVVTIGRQITESLSAHLGLKGREARETAVELLRSVRIPTPQERLRSYPHQLSGGMRQRAAIAIALACEPRLLLADEPTTALDVTVQRQILDLLGAQQQDRHMAMMLVTHDLGVVAGHADDIIVMYAGQIVEKAPTGTLFAQYKHPYTEALIQSIPKMEGPVHVRLQAIGGRPPSLVTPPIGCRFAPRCAYATNLCRAEMPPLIEADDPRHSFRCWHPVQAHDLVGDVTPVREVASSI